MTVFQSAVQALVLRGLSVPLAWAMVEAYQAKKIVNSNVWQRPANDMTVDALLVCFNGITNMKVVDLQKAMKASSKNKFLCVQ